MAKLMKLTDWRNAKGWTQKEVAEKAGILPGTYQAYETGRITVPAKARKKIEKLGFEGEWPEVRGEITREDLRRLHEEIREQARWIQKDLRQCIVLAAAAIQAGQPLPPSLLTNGPAEPQP